MDTASVILVLFSVIIFTKGYSLKVCGKEGFLLDKCIKDSLNTAIPSLAKEGWKKGGSSMDPFVVAKAMTGYSDGNMTLDLLLTDTIITGLGSAVIQEVKSKNLEEGKLELSCKISSISSSGHYQSEGDISTFPLHSEGTFNITLIDLTSLVVLHLESSEDHLQITELNLSLMPSKIEVEAGEELDGDNNLGTTLNVYLNENSFELFELLRPKLLGFLTQVIKDKVNEFLSVTSKESLFPDLDI